MINWWLLTSAVFQAIKWFFIAVLSFFAAWLAVYFILPVVMFNL